MANIMSTRPIELFMEYLHGPATKAPDLRLQRCIGFEKWDFTPSFGYYPRTEHYVKKMIFFIYQENHNMRPQTLTPIQVIPYRLSRKILWLALHGAPSRSIAWAMRNDFEEPLERGRFLWRTSLEQQLEITETFVRVSIGGMAGRSHYVSREFYVKMATDKHEGKNLDYWKFNPGCLYDAIEHALLDEGQEICSARPKCHTTHGEATDAVDDEERWLLWRSIEGPTPRSSHRIPKKMRDFMFNRARSEKMKHCVEELLGYGDGELNCDKEVGLIHRMMDKIMSTKSINWELPGPRPFSPYVGTGKNPGKKSGKKSGNTLEEALEAVKL
ncbi:hypothetical protein LTR84_009548 [Exophiala bonariae]|uniref:Uncharacterized protein n=1 Tax=Exophiala bonariae TaxID=1690606 RepID=A0AAV9MXA8_9EURO|nr:hypothetical protein LTR84_009548 [Exophiala bonariae]